MIKEKKLWELYPEIWKTESEFMSWIRGGIRRIWSKHPVKLEFIKQNRVKIPNPKPNARAHNPKVGGIVTGKQIGRAHV